MAGMGVPEGVHAPETTVCRDSLHWPKSPYRNIHKPENKNTNKIWKGTGRGHLNLILRHIKKNLLI